MGLHWEPIQWIGRARYCLRIGIASFAAALALLFLTACARPPRAMDARGEMSRYVHVCARPPRVPPYAARWIPGARSGEYISDNSIVALAEENTSLSIFIFDPDAPPESVGLLPMTDSRLQCPARPPPPPIIAKKPAVPPKDEAKKDEDVDEGDEKEAKADTQKPAPAPNPKEERWQKWIAQGRQEKPTATKPQNPDPGQRRLSRSNGQPTPRPIDPQPKATKTALKSPQPVTKPLPERMPAEYDDWGLGQPDVSGLDEERARECLSSVCHARHPNFVPKAKKFASPREGQAWSTGGNGKPAGSGTKVKIKTRRLSRPKDGGAEKAPAAGKGDAGKAAGGKKVPNPDGRKGGPEHQKKVQEVVDDIKQRGLTPKTEHHVRTPGGHKENRYVDVAGKRGKDVVEMHQVGKETKGSQPVSRERKALDDIEGAKGQRPTFHPYNK